MASLAKFLEGGAFGVLNDILSEFHSDDGYAVPNRFECLILPPISGSNSSFASGSLVGDPRAVSLRCESTTMPGRNLSAMDDTNIYGPTREIVDGITYAEDINMVFQESSGLEERVFFEEWQKQAVDVTTWDMGYYYDYVSVIDLYLLNRNNKRRFGLRLHEVFPKTIGPTDLNQAAKNEIIKISVSFSFRNEKFLPHKNFAPFGRDFLIRTTDLEEMYL